MYIIIYIQYIELLPHISLLLTYTHAPTHTHNALTHTHTHTHTHTDTIHTHIYANTLHTAHAHSITPSLTHTHTHTHYTRTSPGILSADRLNTRPRYYCNKREPWCVAIVTPLTAVAAAAAVME